MPTNMRIGLKDLQRSGLFYECFRILKEVNPKYWFIENVASMKKEDIKILSEYLECEPIKIDSQIIAPAMRKRLY
jgi:site-specific DNA-cytosine methylase